MGRFDGKVAFITGGARGQGRAHAVRLSQEGADIVVMDVCEQLDGVEYPLATEDDLAMTAKLVESEGRKVLAKKGDVRDLETFQSIFDEALDVFGGIDIVVANAGVMPITDGVAERPEAWKVAIDVMLTGVSHTFRVAIPSMVKRGVGGSVVATASTAGLRPALSLDMATPGMTGYVAAKHGVIGLVTSYAYALAPHKIRVNGVSPTGVNSPMVVNDAFANWAMSHPHVSQVFQNKLDVALIEPEDIAAAVAWICSDEARYITGVNLPVDAGFTL